MSAKIKKCKTKNCVNTSDHGRFIGDFCSPCYYFLTKGEGKTSQAYINLIVSKRIPVKSSNLKNIGYENDTLVIEFKSGGIFIYYKVSKEIYKQLMKAKSPGGVFFSLIKDRHDWKKIKYVHPPTEL